MPNIHLLINSALIIGIIINTTLQSEGVEYNVDINDPIAIPESVPEPIPYKYLGAKQNSITLQNGKMYRIYNHVVSARDVPRTLLDLMDTEGFDRVKAITITQVGVVERYVQTDP